MDKIDFKRDRALYQPPAGRFVPVDVPPLPYVMVDGRGDPNTAPPTCRPCSGCIR